MYICFIILTTKQYTMSKNSEEKWVDVIDYEEFYQVSDLGNFRSKDRLRKKARSEGVFMLKGRNIKPWKNTNGYWMIGLRKNNKPKYFLAHRLVYQSFKGRTDLSIDHIIEGNPSDIRLVNLQPLNHRQNLSKYFSHKLNKSSKYIGVCFSKPAKKWQSNIRINGRRYSLGHFVSECDANKAYQNALRDYTLNGKLPKTKKYNKYRHVLFDKRKNRWVAKWWSDGRLRYIGVFNSEEKAFYAQQQYLKINNL